MPILAWALIYADGSRFTSRDGSWTDAPRDGVQIMVWYHRPPYRTLDYGHDTYRLPGEKAVKKGRWMPDEDWEPLRVAVHEESTWL